VATQMELSLKHAATQVSGCRECQSLALVMEGSRDTTCVRCEQVGDLLSMVAELKEEVARLRSIRECEREINWWSHPLPSLRRARQMEASRGEAPLPSCHQAEGGDPRDGGGWMQIPAQRSRRILSRPTSPPQVPLHNRYEALELEGQEDEDTDSDPSKGMTGGNQSAPRIKPATGKKKRRVIVIGNSLRRGTEGPICRPDPSHGEVCCLPGARIRDITRKLPRLVKASHYYPLVVVQVGSDVVAERRTKTIKRDFRELGRLLEGSGAQAVFSSIPSVAGRHTERNRKTQLINTWLRGWCQQWNFGVFSHGAVYMAPGLLETDGVHLLQRGKRILAQELAGLIERALN
ncbi:hypothetical protein Y956_05133, partial [Nipponia nippon]